MARGRSDEKTRFGFALSIDGGSRDACLDCARHCNGFYGANAMRINKDTKILCVCTNNYFRSQICAELLAARGFTTRSAGTSSAYVGKPPSPLVLVAINKRGGECDGYEPCVIDQEALDWADVVLCAEKVHIDFIDEINSFTGQLMYMSQMMSSGFVKHVPDNGVDNAKAVREAADMIAMFIENSTWIL